MSRYVKQCKTILGPPSIDPYQYTWVCLLIERIIHRTSENTYIILCMYVCCDLSTCHTGSTMSSADMCTFMHSVNFGGSGSQDSGGFTACPKRAIGALGERGGKPGSFNRLVGPGGPWIQKEGQEAYTKHSTSIHSALLVLKEFTELLSIEHW